METVNGLEVPNRDGDLREGVMLTALTATDPQTGQEVERTTFTLWLR